MVALIVSQGFKPGKYVYDAFLKGVCEKGETNEIFNLFFEMAKKGIVLDLKLTSTILTCLCHTFEDVDVIELVTNSLY